MAGVTKIKVKNGKASTEKENRFPGQGEQRRRKTEEEEERERNTHNSYVYLSQWTSINLIHLEE